MTQLWLLPTRKEVPILPEPGESTEVEHGHEATEQGWQGGEEGWWGAGCHLSGETLGG